METPWYYYILAFLYIVFWGVIIVWAFKKAMKRKAEKEEQQRKAQEEAIASVDRAWAEYHRTEERQRQQEKEREKMLQENCRITVRGTFSSNPIYTQVIPQEAQKWAQKLADLKSRQISVVSTFRIDAGQSFLKIGETTYYYNDYGLQDLPDHKHDGYYYYAEVRNIARDKFIQALRNELNRRGIACKITYQDLSISYGYSCAADITCQIGTLSSW